MKKMRKNTKGFTLMEMLIVIAIIAIIAAIAIPVYSTQLNNARLATDAANLRTAESLAVSDMMLNVNSRGASTSLTPTIAATPDATAAEKTVANATAYYFKTASQGSGLEIAFDEETGGLADSGDFASSYNEALTIVVFVDADGRVVEAGWVSAN